MKCLYLLLFCFVLLCYNGYAQSSGPVFRYVVTTPEARGHVIHVELQSKGWDRDTVVFKMPKWTPGYYQIMDYGKAVAKVTAAVGQQVLPVVQVSDNTWKVAGIKGKSFTIRYDVTAERKFVANSYRDSARIYIVPASVFLYVDGFIKTPVSVKMDVNAKWKVATGLESIAGRQNEWTAADFDVLYDCPILAGDLEELPPFKVRGVTHRFIGYNMGTFDRDLFMKNLERVVSAGVDIIGDVPFKQYTFIGIGPGRGGIEHLNNTTVSFEGKGLDTPEGMNRMMNFLAHEYFHHYNVKRIRPFELGPFDYERGSRTNLLWVSEGLSVYYEYLMVKRAGLINEQALYADFEHNLDATENNPGRLYQSLTQASYKTWSDGPFGKQGEDAGKAISYYDKGPVVGLLLDFAIRNATQNKKSLDDVMRLLYWKYYSVAKRGFTDAEFEQACETVAMTSLTEVFEYVYTTKELDYNKYLGYGGLKVVVQELTENGVVKKKFLIQPVEQPDGLQAAIRKSWGD